MDCQKYIEVNMTSKNITNFSLNGENYYTTNNTINLCELTNFFYYKNSLLVLEYNGLIFNKKDWKKIIVKNQDKIEVVTIVGGG